MRRTTLVFAILLLILCVSKAQENTGSTKAYQTIKINDPIQLDGIISERIWEKVNWGKDFRQTEPQADQAPSFATQFKILYDQDYLYVAFRCYDNDPSQIVGAITPRDFFDGDWVEINIDSDFDRKEAYSFTITAKGIRGDEYIKNPEQWYNDWNPNWSAKTQIDDQGWTAEIKIPLTELKITRPLPHWGIQVNRNMGRSDESSSWVYIPEESGEWVERFGLLKGIEEMPIAATTELADPNEKIPAEELQEDFKVLRDAFVATYPSLTRFRSSAFMQQSSDQVLKQLEKALDLEDFYGIIGEYLNLIGDGHLSLQFPDEYENHLQNQLKKLPLKLMVNQDAVYVIESYSKENDLKKGTRIISIEGQPVQDIVSSICNQLCSDGYNLTGKYNELSHRFAYYLALMTGPKDQMNLEIISPGASYVKAIELPLLSDAAIAELQKANPPNNKPVFDLSIEGTLAIMTIRTFNDPYQFQQFVDKSFVEIRGAGVKKLILDFRGNGGGEETNAIHLYSYLVDQPFKYYDRYEVSLKPGQKEINALEHYKSFENIQFLSTISALDQEGRIVIDDFEVARLIDPQELQSSKPNPFTGEILVLIDGGSFSATSELSAVMHRDQRAKFVGQETGGTYHGNTSGIYGDLVLPNSGLKIKVPLIKYISAVGETKAEFGKGVMPDYPIEVQQKHLVNGVDPVMDFAKELFSKN